MVSEAKGLMYIPVWVDDGVIKALVLDDGSLPITEQTPLTSIQANMYGDRADVWQKVRVSSGRSLHIFITGQSGDVIVQQTTPGDLRVGAHGYDGSSWRKNALLWGYSDTLFIEEQEISNVTGTFTMESSEVPAGEIWVVSQVTCMRAITTGIIVRLAVYDGSNWIDLVDYPIAAINTYYLATTALVLKATQKLRFVFYGAINGENCVGTYCGYKQEVTM